MSKQQEEQKGFTYIPLTGMWLQDGKVRGKRFYKGTFGKDLDILLFPNSSKVKNAPQYNLVISKKNL